MSKLKSFALILGVLIMSFLVGYLVLAWTEPGAAPPGDNAPAPLNVSSNLQTKTGTLRFTRFEDADLNSWFVDPSVVDPGVSAAFRGRVGIGTTPGEKLDVAGNINYTGQLTKLDVADNFNASVGCADFQIGHSSRRGTPGRAIVDLGAGEIRFNYGPDWTKASIGSPLDVLGNLTVSGTVQMTGFKMATGASSGYILTSDASGIGTWQAPAAGGIGGSGTATQVAFFTADTTIDSDSNLYWDNTNKRLGIGDTTPDYKLDVVGDIRAQNAWLRTTGNTGWYSDTHGGGWYMSDATWVRSYNNKDVYTGGVIRADNGFQVDGYEMVGSNADMLYANRRNTGGGGIWISDDGGFYDYNVGYIDFRGSTGIRVLESDGSWGNNSIRANYLCMKDDCRSTWPSGGVGYWTQAGSNLYPNNTAWNVGIGTTSPGAKLDVRGNLKVYSDWESQFIDQDAYIFLQPRHNDGYGRIGVYDSSAGWRNLVLQDGGGNVGIGTTSPHYKLSFGGGTANTKLAIWDGGVGHSFGLGVQSGQFRFNLNQSSDRFSFLDAEAGNEIVTITGNGDVKAARDVKLGGWIYMDGSDFKMGLNDGRSIGSKTDQRALVHEVSDVLVVNYAGDFEGGTRIDSDLDVGGDITQKGYKVPYCKIYSASNTEGEVRTVIDIQDCKNSMCTLTLRSRYWTPAYDHNLAHGAFKQDYMGSVWDSSYVNDWGAKNGQGTNGDSTYDWIMEAHSSRCILYDDSSVEQDVNKVTLWASHASCTLWICVMPH